MLVEILIIIFTIVLNLFLGLIVIRANHKSATHRLLALLTIIIAFWALTNYISLHSDSETMTLFWIRSVMFLTAPLGPVIFLLLHTFPNTQIRLKTRYLVIISALMISTMILAYTPFIFSGAVFKDGSITPLPGLGMPIFAIDFVGLCLVSFGLLIKKLLKATNEEKNQLRYLVYGIVFTFSLIILIYGSVVIFKSSSLVMFGPMTSLIFVGFVTFAIIKHEILDIKILTTEIFSTLIWIVLFTRLVVKIFSNPPTDELIIDIFIFVAMLIFGYLLIRSVTKEVTQREKLQDLTNQLKELDARKDEFLSIATHELRAPMTAIKGYISMLLDGDAGKLPTEAESFLRVAQSSTDRLIRLVNNMLNVARIEQGRQVYQLGIVSLSEVVDTVFNEFKLDADKKKLNYTLSKNIEIDTVYVDLDRIHEVVANLISNSIKYTDEGSVQIKLNHPSGYTGSVRFEVVDTGRGIALEDQQQIFQKYYRVQDRMERKTGTGLGLYIAKVLVEKFGGKIGFVSELNKGSTFWFELSTVVDDQGKPKVIT